MISGGSAELLNEVGFASDRARQSIAMIKDATEKAADLTCQLLAFSRQQLLQPLVLDLNVVIVGLWRMLPRLIGEDVTMDRDLAPNLGYVSADRCQIE